MHRKFTQNVAVLVAVLLFFGLISTGCENGSAQEAAVNDFIEQKVSDTLLAMENRDVELVRDIWSDLSELSLSLEEDEALSAQVAALALSYEKLIAYCDIGNEEDLNQFKSDFKTAAEGLKEIMIEEGYDCSSIEDILKNAYV